MSEFYKSDGITAAERYLARLGEHSFLSLWSYPCVYRDEGQVSKGGDGQEVCDLLVVFGEHVLIFSDKDCEYKDYGDSVLNWKRWYKKAILKSAAQVWGAESWIRRHPTRLFCDRKCQVPLPVELPPLEQMKVHRIVVAHGITEHCKRSLGGSGSIHIDTTIADNAHYDDQGGRVEILPFRVGIIDSAKGYIHVLDDVSLDILMQNLDTITDFVRYLERREKLVQKPGFQVLAFGEADLMACYLGDVNEKDEHDFLFREGAAGISIEEGFWDKFSRSTAYARQQNADRISYGWDRMIEFVAGHFHRRTLYFSTDPSFKALEYQLRILAQESRLSRRMLARSIVEIAEKSKNEAAWYATRIIFSQSFPHICYVAFLFNREDGFSYEQYREMRRDFMRSLALVAKLKFFGRMKTLVVIGTEFGGVQKMVSYDILTYKAEEWDPDEKKSAEELSLRLPFLKNIQLFSGHEDEYPSE